MPQCSSRVIVYGKVVDDKEIGIYIEDIYFGGLAQTEEEEEEIKRYCANNIRGGYAVPKSFEIEGHNSLPQVFVEARRRFHDMERTMCENEQILEANQSRTKRKR